MLKLLCVAAIVAVVACQLPNWGNLGNLGNLGDWLQGLQGALGTFNSVDSIHGYNVQYDDDHNVFIFVNNDKCYLVPATSERWDEVVHNEDSLHKFTERVYEQILSNTGVTSMTQDAAQAEFHSRLEQWECRNKHIYKIEFQTPTA